ncbi:hypothetical protein ACVIW2_004506 [Bradyrhizobium huanghuaihaiense]
MRTYYVDETGFTGEDLLAADQPIFLQATNDLSEDEADRLIASTFGGLGSTELKYSRLARGGRHQDRIVEFIGILAQDPLRAGAWIAHKEFAMMTLIVDWWMEPLAYEAGLNLYKDGANHGMANMLYFCLESYWSKGFRRKVLEHFQRMLRTRTLERYTECQLLIEKARRHATGDPTREELLRYLSVSFMLLGYDHVRRMPERALDIALTGLVQLGHMWTERHSGPWSVVHDQSSNMSKQKWIWDAYSAETMPPAKFENPGTVARFPMNVTQTRFGDSAQEKQLQICDVLAGACSAFARFDKTDAEHLAYRDRLGAAGIENFFTGVMWPVPEVTPEGLGRRGWDGNAALEYLTQNMRAKRPEPKP